jgi:hypothetical protein
MLVRIGKFLGIITPLVSLISAYKMLFGINYIGASSNSSTPQISTTLRATAFELAVRSGSKEAMFWTLFWPITIFLLSCIASYMACKWITIPI